MPHQMVLALRIMWTIWGAWALFAIAMLVKAAQIGTPSLAVLAVTYALVIGLLALLVRAVARGRNWARWVYSIFISIGMISGILGLIRGMDSLLRTALFVLLCLGYVVVLRLLFHSSSRSWFKAASKPAT